MSHICLDDEQVKAGLAKLAEVLEGKPIFTTNGVLDDYFIEIPSDLDLAECSLTRLESDTAY